MQSSKLKKKNHGSDWVYRRVAVLTGAWAWRAVGALRLVAQDGVGLVLYGGVCWWGGFAGPLRGRILLGSRDLAVACIGLGLCWKCGSAVRLEWCLLCGVPGLVGLLRRSNESSRPVHVSCPSLHRLAVLVSAL